MKIILIAITLLLLLPISSYAKHLVTAEYFIDADPGEGNGIPISGTYGDTTVTVSLTGISTTGISYGTHIIFTRFQDSEGNWGQTGAALLNISDPDLNPKTLTTAEYYIDTDPGEGNGIPISGTYGDTTVTVSITGISTTGISYGTHIIFTRFQDSEGNWGQTGASLLNISDPDLNPKTLTTAEYFIDTDPGEGNGTVLSGAFGSSTVNAFISGISTDNLSFGTHTVYIRFQDSDGQWGTLISKLLNISSLYPENYLIESEYYIDADPGIGNGIPLLPQDGSFNSPTEIAYLEDIDSSPLSIGNHILYVRFQDVLYQWSVDKPDTFEVIYSGPLPPTNLSTTGTLSSIDLIWNHSLGSTPTGYCIYRGTDPDIVTRIDSVLYPDLTYSDYSVPNYGIYYYRISGFDAQNFEGPMCLAVSGTLDRILPVDSLNISISGSNIVLNWPHVTHTVNGNPVTIDYYKVYGSEEGPYGSFSFINGTGTNSLTHWGVLNFGLDKYFYYVTCFKITDKESEKELLEMIENNNIERLKK